MLKARVWATALLMVTIAPLHAFGAIPALRSVQSQLSFEVASIRPGTPGDRSGAFDSPRNGSLPDAA